MFPFQDLFMQISCCYVYNFPKKIQCRDHKYFLFGTTSKWNVTKQQMYINLQLFLYKGVILALKMLMMINWMMVKPLYV